MGEGGHESRARQAQALGGWTAFQKRKIPELSPLLPQARLHTRPCQAQASTEAQGLMPGGSRWASRVGSRRGDRLSPGLEGRSWAGL